MQSRNDLDSHNGTRLQYFTFFLRKDRLRPFTKNLYMVIATRQVGKYWVSGFPVNLNRKMVCTDTSVVGKFQCNIARSRVAPKYEAFGEVLGLLIEV